MEAQRLLIAEGNEDIRWILAQELQSHYYVRCCATGPEALSLIRREKPELLLLSMNLPEMDGLTLLETIVSEGIHPMVLATTDYRSEYLVEAAYRLGVSYILMKPYSLEQVARRLQDMRQCLRSLPAKPTAEQLLEQLLQPIGVYPQLSGYHILEKVLLLMAEEPTAPLCKAAYLHTAQYFGTTYCAVESTIRRLLSNCQKPEIWQTYFPAATQPPKPKYILTEIAHRLREALE